MRFLSLCIVLAVTSIVACSAEMRESDSRHPSEAQLAVVTDYKSLLARLRAGDAGAKPGGEVEQPFFSVTGKTIELYGDHIQVFEYPDAAAVEKQAAVISPNGTTVETTSVHWIAPPHFYKQGKLLVLYVGDNEKVLNALVAAIGPPFAGGRRSQ